MVLSLYFRHNFWLVVWKEYNYKKFHPRDVEISKKFDDLITYLIFAIIIGGRAGYIIFYNPEFYFYNPQEILKFGKVVCLSTAP